MSEAATKSDGSVSLDSDGFAKLWAAFYDQADGVANRKIFFNPDVSKQRQRVAKLLDTITKLIFGLDEGKKAIAINYGGGGMELIIQLVHSADVLPSNGQDDVSTEPLLMSGLKAIKCCVVRNKVGRSRCRSAGTFEFLSSVFEHALTKAEAAALVEEALTTLAAMCLGDDLNALQGAMQLRKYVDSASEKYPDDQYPSLQQKVKYLVALFDVVEKEQKDLIERIQEEDIDFFGIISNSEVTFRSGLDCYNKKEFQEAENNYNSAYVDLKSLLRYTSMVENLVCQVLEQRSAVRLAMGNYDGALTDADNMLVFRLPVEGTVRAQTLRAEAFEGLGKKEEAQEALGKALIVNPQNDALQSKLQKLSVP